MKENLRINFLDYKQKKACQFSQHPHKTPTCAASLRLILVLGRSSPLGAFLRSNTVLLYTITAICKKVRQDTSQTDNIILHISLLLSAQNNHCDGYTDGTRQQDQIRLLYYNMLTFFFFFFFFFAIHKCLFKLT